MKARLRLLLTCTLLTACQAKQTAKENAHERVSFDHAEFTDITPMTDGSAYATSVDSQLWYVRGEHAVRVVLLPTSSDKPPESFEVDPVADGSAYLTVLSGEGGLWHLQAEHAQKVTEVSALYSLGKSSALPEKAFFALYVAEHKKRKDAEYRADNPPEPEDDSPDYDPY